MHLSDYIGRRGAAIIYQTLNLFAITMLIYVKHFRTLIFIIFLYGLTILVKVTTSYTYALELVPDTKTKKYSQTDQIFESFLMLFIPMLYYFSQDMKVIIGIVAVVSFLGLIVTYFTPESPRILYAKERWDDLRKSFTII